MENGFYGQRITDSRVTDFYINDETCNDLLTAKLFNERDQRMEKAKAMQDLKDRQAARKQKAEHIKRVRTIRDCIRYATVGLAACIAYFCGPIALVAIAAGSFGAVCWRIGR